jgi:hypothetical protein
MSSIIYYSPSCAYSVELLELVRAGAGGGPSAFRFVDITRQRPPAYVDRIPALVRDGLMYTDEPLFALFEMQEHAAAPREPDAPQAADGALLGGAFSGFFAPLDGVDDAMVMRNECDPSGPAEHMVLEEAQPMPSQDTKSG